MNELMAGGAGLGAGWAAMQGANCMRQQASYTQELAQQYKAQWSAVIDAEGNMTANLKQDILNTVNAMQETKEQMELGQAVHKKYMKQIEMWGIILISIIFFLLLLKTLGLLSPLGSIFIMPFKAIFKGKQTKTNTSGTTLSHHGASK